MTRVIGLTQGKFTFVDDEDYEMLMQYEWVFSPGGRYGYAYIKGTNIWMHRLILGCEDKNLQVDHINRRSLDNRRSNLRLATHAQNRINSPKQRNNTSGYKGVIFDKATSRWLASIGHQKKNIHLGRYDTAIQAAFAYDAAAKELKGEFAYLNFPSCSSVTTSHISRRVSL